MFTTAKRTSTSGGRRFICLIKESVVRCRKDIYSSLQVTSCYSSCLNLSMTRTTNNLLTCQLVNSEQVLACETCYIYLKHKLVFTLPIVKSHD